MSILKQLKFDGDGVLYIIPEPITDDLDFPSMIEFMNSMPHDYFHLVSNTGELEILTTVWVKEGQAHVKSFLRKLVATDKMSVTEFHLTPIDHDNCRYELSQVGTVKEVQSWDKIVVSVSSDESLMKLTNNGTKLDVVGKGILHILWVFINKLGEKQTRMSNQTVSYKLGKKNYRNQEVTYITNTKYINDNKTSKLFRDMDWTHSWVRRGSWRYFPNKPDFIGKDQSGNRNQKGRTWVNESIVNEDLGLPLLQRPRILI
jgi:hypothetical protein